MTPDQTTSSSTTDTSGVTFDQTTSAPSSGLSAPETPPAPAQPTPALTSGQVVEFQATDPITGAPMPGVGIVVHHDSQDGTLVAPVQLLGLRLSDEEVFPYGERPQPAE